MTTTPTLPTDAPATGPARPGRRRAGSASGGGTFAEQRRKLLIPFVGPALLFYVVLFVVPIGGAIWISLHHWAGSGPMTWAGLGNYTRLFHDDLFIKSLGNTLKLLFFVGIAVFALSFALTLVLRDMVGRKVVRSVIFFPHLVNALVYGVLVGFLFNPDGLANSLLAHLGISSPPQWLAQDNLFPLIMVTMAWMTTGYFTTILMAGVDRIPISYYEDCALAGANALQRLRYVILPLTWDVFGVCAVLWTISSVKIFEIVWIFGGSSGNGIPPTKTWTSAVYTYATAFSGDSVPSYGAATASAILSLLLVTVLVVLLRRVMRREAVEF
ncbi:MULTISPECIES: carbohydrate ABC transporter permease [unclassified Streptomyces]|uniref:carbohydrate ABC transporter permease n=1 Tax=unclassified Streptomyces TaxID=2593676 RepID=UPI002E2A73EA|nr:sugar ABC transporter permease [Streptomyces sp. NBC_00223]